MDLRTGELRKNGIRIKLQDQPFQVLRALVERPGELVTREEIQRRVWGDNTFVDFDQSLNRAVNKVREALGDTAEHPRYVETMARRGYRFIVPVEGAFKPVESPAAGAGRRWNRLAWAAMGILATAGGGFWLTRSSAPPPAPRLVQLTTLPGEEVHPAFSPDGTHVAFAWDGETRTNFDVYVKMVGGTTASRLTSHPARDMLPAWSPDGQRIAFYSQRDEGGIYLVSPAGGPERKLADLRITGRPVWTADGKHLLVSKQSGGRSAEAGAGALFLVPTVEGEGAPREFLVPPPRTWFKSPALGPDGRSLAFASCTGPLTGPRCSLQVVELQAGLVAPGNLRQIRIQDGAAIESVAWAPDGSSLIYSASLLGPATHLWRVSLRNGNEPERLELAGGGAYSPAIDHKNGRLAFSRMHRLESIWRLERGGKPAQFIASSGAFDRNPQYSPDGRRIAFESSRHVASMAVWTANADGKEPFQVTSIASSWSGTPRWSPDGRWLAFDARGLDGGWDVWIVEASGGLPRQLTHGPADNAVPSWSHDGKSIYFASRRSGRFEVWRMPAAGGAAVQITRNGGLAAFESPDGRKLYYTLSEGGSEGLFARLLPDGEEEQVLKDGVFMRGFVVFPDGVCYLHRLEEQRHEIRFHAFAGGESQVVGEIRDGTLTFGLAVSPDRKTFLFTKRSDAGNDLMLIENFR